MDQLIVYLTDGQDVVFSRPVGSLEDLGQLNASADSFTNGRLWWVDAAEAASYQSELRAWNHAAGEAWEAWARASAYAEDRPVGTPESAAAWNRADDLWQEYLAARKVQQ